MTTQERENQIKKVSEGAQTLTDFAEITVDNQLVGIDCNNGLLTQKNLLRILKLIEGTNYEVIILTPGDMKLIVELDIDFEE